MTLHQAKLSITIAIFVIVASVAVPAPRARAQNSTSLCDRTCGTGESAKRVDYPFGFSSGCEIKLSCTPVNANESEITIGGFRVLNVTRSSILVSLPAACDRSVWSVSPLFAASYAPTWANGFLLQNCSTPPSGGSCLIPTSFVKGRFGAEHCEARSDNISCFSPENRGFDVMGYEVVGGTGCKFLFSAVSAVGSDENSLEFQVIELGWWMAGSCGEGGKCGANANCTEVRLANGGNGSRCECREGFEGDGFAAGGGCQRVSSCNASKYFSGDCKGSSRIGLLIGGLIAGASTMAGLAGICFFIRRRSSLLRSRMSAKRLLDEAAGNSSVPLYPYKYIEKATNRFSEKQRLGNGAYGTVYAGKLHSNEWVAVKRIKNRDTDSIEQVMNEIKLLSSVSHPNLVRLLGCCIERDQQILVYEYMPNGTLSQHLQKERGKGLPWTVRLTIAAETANAIAYLHSAVNPPIYHRDIKSSNILLDYSYNSKVADFGLSRLGMVESELSHISTAPQGTPGYLDPQYHQNFHLSDKSDVYSFGVVLVEIITGQKVVDFSRPHTEINLAALAIDRIGKGCVDELIDPILDPHRDAWTLSSIHKVAELTFRCLAFHSDTRPSMTEVAEELEHVRQSGWAPLDEDVACAASSAASICSLPYEVSVRSTGGASSKKKTGAVNQKLLVPPKPAECSSLEEVKDSSPVSVQDPWLSDQSSPSSNSLLNNAIQR
ncbi:wall-associated receptor kinase-like 14 [Rhodamnia argentea]|uniref:Wall-associated receptor kinase-like 14 n=1 Tax=Rhodamnia argentea TaxID=178133 RepID=A0ABM3GV35_9MYRT|nr:wall-associated receptor kinase-like 14 [Rhodamnia argentea]